MNGWDEGRLHSAVLVSPRREKRRDRRTRRAAAKSLLADDHETRKAKARTKADELADERRATVLLPRAG
ncbi:MAG: ATP-binding protein, partial [Actinomycetota bacterium]|nr:ATP-binding protein [Actinomycetota bacterium]